MTFDFFTKKIFSVSNEINPEEQEEISAAQDSEINLLKSGELTLVYTEHTHGI